MPHNTEQNTKTKTPSFEIQRNKFRALWEQIFHRQRDEILIQEDTNGNILVHLDRLKPAQRNFKVFQILDMDFSPMVPQINPNDDPTSSFDRMHKNWEIIFENLDINLIPYIRTEIVYDQGGNDEGELEFIEDFTEDFPEGLQVFNRNRMFQVEDIPSDPTSDIKKVTLTQTLDIRHLSETLRLKDFEVKLLAYLVNPSDYI